MGKLLCVINFLLVSLTIVNSLTCLTGNCTGPYGSRKCASTQLGEVITCGLPLIGYQTVCSYVITDHPIDGYQEETACDLVPVGPLRSVDLKRCVDEDYKGKVLHCKICDKDLCNSFQA
uniref:Protein sleepless n=1 Tax=Photinus pyralis TaxID=7054 RepID=A0A1Y1KEK7_PHOPY